MSYLIAKAHVDGLSVLSYCAESWFIAAAQTLPMELVLRILDSLALVSRDWHPAYAFSLSLVSRAVRASILPLLYEVLVLNAKESTDTVVGWDGRNYDHPAVAFLSWLLCNPTAPPRQHIKHLVFNHSYVFYASELVLPQSENRDRSGIDRDNVPFWTLDGLTVKFPSDAVSLQRAGIHARAVHWLDVLTPPSPSNSLSSHALDIAARMNSDDPLARSCMRYCTKHAPVNLSNLEAGALWNNVVRYQEIDLERGVEGRTAPVDMQGVHLFIEVDLERGLEEGLIALVGEIAAIITVDPRVVKRVVLECASDTLEDVVGDLARTVVQRLPEPLHKDVHIVRSWWPDRTLLRSDPPTALARAIHSGIDPWKSGSRLVDIDTSSRYDLGKDS